MLLNRLQSNVIEPVFARLKLDKEVRFSALRFVHIAAFRTIYHSEMHKIADINRLILYSFVYWEPGFTKLE